MDARFSFDVARSLGLVRIRMTGLFTLDDVHDFIQARREVHEALGPVPQGHLTLTDVRGIKIQPQEIISAFREMLLAEPQYRARRVAFVAEPTLVRNQFVRALARPDVRCFDDPHAAEVWLLAEDRPRLRAAG